MRRPGYCVRARPSRAPILPIILPVAAWLVPAAGLAPGGATPEELVKLATNAGADIGAIAAAINLLVPIPTIPAIVPVSLGLVALQVLGSYRLIETVFKWLTLALLAYVGAAVFARPDAGAVLVATIIPEIRLEPGFIAILVALLGTTISPYLFFWQASQEVEEESASGAAGFASARARLPPSCAPR